MKGYKVFNPDWSCRGFQYEVGQTYEMAENPKCCSRGFHFCERLVDCFNYYSFDPDNRVAEVEALGDIDTSKNGKSCTNKIRIVRELTWEEVLSMCNTGKGNTGNWNSGNSNSGNYNSGNWNSGDWNSGYRNSGNSNSGDWNSGYRNSGNSNSGNSNSGYRNSGDYNSGNYNSGDWNSGNYNSGDWNAGDYNTGCFNVEKHKITLFDKQSSWTYENWLDSKAKRVVDTCPVNCLEWVSASEMSDTEKVDHSDYKVTGGYLKKIKYTPADKLAWWNNLSENDRKHVQALPNFDEEKFLQCIGAKKYERDNKTIPEAEISDVLWTFCRQEAQYRCTQLGIETTPALIDLLADKLHAESEKWIDGEKICEIIICEARMNS